MTRTAIVVTHGGRPEALVALREAMHELTAAGFTVVLHDQDIPTPHGDLMGVQRPETADAEIVVVLGGDGTILRAAVHRVAARDYEVEERGVVEVEVRAPGHERPVIGWALNEATVEKADRQRMLEVAIEVDGRPLSSFGCDGVVISTATGSTAHAFSAGGPVVWPDVDAMLLVPLAAHALFARPLVVGPRSTFAVEIVTRSQSGGVLTLDGRRRIDVAPGARIEVRRGSDPVRLARLSHAPFTDRLVRKFSLPVVGWRGGAPRTGSQPVIPHHPKD